MRRRRVLGLCAGCLAGLAGLAGCQGRDRPTSTDEGRDRTADTVGRTASKVADDTASADDDTPGGHGHTSRSPSARAIESGTRGETDVSIGVVALEPDALISYTDVVGLDESDGTQFLFLDVSVTAGDPPRRDDFHLRFDGRAASPLFPDRQLWRFLGGPDVPYDGESGSGRIAFELPNPVDANGLSVTWPGGERHLTDVTVPPSFRTRLASPPAPLSLDVAIPDEVPWDANPTIPFTVTNEGDVPTRFVAGLNRQGPRIAYTPVAGVSELVRAGATETVRVTDSFSVRDRDQGTGDGEPDVTYDVRWAGGEIRRDVRLTASSDARSAAPARRSTTTHRNPTDDDTI